MNQALMGGIRAMLQGDGDGDEPVVDDKVRSAWNQFVDWMAQKGMKGKPALDTDGLGFKMLEQYRQENPSTILTKNHILPIQRAFQEYRTKALENIKAGKAGYDGKEESFMPGLSKLDGYPGQYTTNYKFPYAVSTLKDNGVIRRDTIPFAPTDLTKLKRN